MLNLAQGQAHASQTGIGMKCEAMVGDEPTPDGSGFQAHLLQVPVMPAPRGIRLDCTGQRFQPLRISCPLMQGLAFPAGSEAGGKGITGRFEISGVVAFGAGCGAAGAAKYPGGCVGGEVLGMLN